LGQLNTQFPFFAFICKAAHCSLERLLRAQNDEVCVFRELCDLVKDCNKNIEKGLEN
jgi:hypothetical protein